MAPGESKKRCLKTVDVVSLCAKPSDEGEGKDQLRWSSYPYLRVRLHGGGASELVAPRRGQSQGWAACSFGGRGSGFKAQSCQLLRGRLFFFFLNKTSNSVLISSRYK